MMVPQGQDKKPEKLKRKWSIPRWLWIIIIILILMVSIWSCIVQGLPTASTIFGFLASIVAVVAWIWDMMQKEEKPEPTPIPVPVVLTPHDQPVRQPLLPQPRVTRIDLQGAPLIEQFYGREQQLQDLQDRFIKSVCRLFAIIGNAGVGKTTLIRKFIETQKDAFDFIIWRSLINPPSLRELISSCLYQLSQGQQVILPEEIGQQITILLEFLDDKRCCLILDNVESILLPKTHHGEYLPEFADYGLLFRKMGETPSKGCLLITSRELPRGIALSSLFPRSVSLLSLSGLELSAASQLLEHEGLHAEQPLMEKLVSFYEGNPLALSLCTDYVREMGGNLEQFLSLDHGLNGSISRLLAEQFNRLSPLEHQIMYLLGAAREPRSLQQLQRDLFYHPDQHKEIHELEEAVSSLKGRSLLVRVNEKFGLQPVILEYTVNCILEQLVEEIKTMKG